MENKRIEQPEIERLAEEAEPFLERKYADNGAFSHWELIDINTGNILWSNEEGYTAAKDKGVGMKLLLKVKNFNEGIGEYDFSNMNDSDRDNVTFDTWLKIKQEIDMFLENHPESPSPSPASDCIAVGFAEWIRRKYRDTVYSIEELFSFYKLSPEYKSLNIGEGKIDWETIEKEFRTWIDGGLSSATSVFSWFKSRPEFKVLNIGNGKIDLPTDTECEEWFDANIAEGCSASSGIYKFRLWLKDRERL